MATASITKTLECGPGKVLGGLSRRIDRSLTSFSIEDPAGLEKALAENA